MPNDEPPVLDRRKVVALGASAAWVIGPAFAQGTISQGAEPRSPALPERLADGFTSLEARPGVAQLRPAPKPPTPVWGYEGRVPGPVLRVRRGEELKVRLVNRLDQPTSIHWHGVRVPNAMDGVAGLTQAPVAPGGSFDYRFIAPDAGTYWFHPHVAEQLSEQLDRGLHGVLIVEEATPPATDREVLAVVDDWRLDPDGVTIADFGSPAEAAGPGRLGNLLTVNGQGGPVSESLPPGGRARVRLVNVANARALGIRVEGGLARLIAVDGQPSSTAFEPKRGAFLLPPGGRVELMIDLPAEGGGSARIVAMLGEVAVPLVVLSPAGERRPPLPPIAPLPANDLPERLDLARAQRFDLAIEGGAPGGAGKIWRLTSRASDGAARPLFSVKRGAHIVLAFANRSRIAHAMHWHGHHARVLFAFDDGWDPFWQDTIIVPPNATTRIVLRADNPGKWALTSSVPEHLAAGLAGWFEVT